MTSRRLFSSLIFLFAASLSARPHWRPAALPSSYIQDTYNRVATPTFGEPPSPRRDRVRRAERERAHAARARERREVEKSRGAACRAHQRTGSCTSPSYALVWCALRFCSTPLRRRHQTWTSHAALSSVSGVLFFRTRSPFFLLY